MNKQPGLSFERAVAQVQAQLDANASVIHDETIVDRLGQARQFDVVIRGKFAGQQLLGVIECKDTKRKIGTPEVDAFVTKSQDVRANVRILMSRRGFTKPALEKCAHYGVQALSLIGPGTDKPRLFLGTRWQAELWRWGRISVTLLFVEEPSQPIPFHAEQLTLDGRKVLDWYINYLLDNRPHWPQELGWLLGVGVEFSVPQAVELSPGLTRELRAIEFVAERICEKYERMVPVTGTGFYDWNSKQATFAPGTSIQTDPVSMDFREWSSASSFSSVQPPPGFMNVHLVAEELQFERIANAIDLDLL